MEYVVKIWLMYLQTIETQLFWTEHTLMHLTFEIYFCLFVWRPYGVFGCADEWISTLTKEVLMCLCCSLNGVLAILADWQKSCFSIMMHCCWISIFGDTDSALTLLFCHSWHGCAVLSESHFLVHGGYNGNDALSDTFIFNTGETRCSSYYHFISRFVFLADKWPLDQVQCPYLLNAPFHEVLESLIFWTKIKQHVQSFCNYFNRKWSFSSWTW